MIGIVDYGVGNLFSLKSSLAMLGQETVVTGDKEVLAKCDRVILPGVGAFEDAIAKLKENGMDEFVKELASEGKPLMGICLGMQLMFDESHEYGIHKGLGLIPGKVVAFKGMINEELKIPHIGWNALAFKKEHPLFKYVEEGECVYFVHSFHAVECEDYLVATAEYDIDVTATVVNGNVIGCQFHPEKSGKTGLNILKAFCEL